jgi:hypothetical protein
MKCQDLIKKNAFPSLSAEFDPNKLTISTITEDIRQIMPQALALSLPVRGTDHITGLGLSLGLFRNFNRGPYQGTSLDLGTDDMSYIKAQLWWLFDNSKGNRIVMTEEDISGLITIKKEIIDIDSQMLSHHQIKQIDAQREAQVLVLDVNRSPPSNISAHAFRDHHPTHGMHEAMRRALVLLRSPDLESWQDQFSDQRLGCGFDRGLDQSRTSGVDQDQSGSRLGFLESLELLPRYNGYHSIEEYAWLLEKLWANYQPGLGLGLDLDQGFSLGIASKGLKLTPEESEEALQLLIEWAELRSNRGLLTGLGIYSGIEFKPQTQSQLEALCFEADVSVTVLRQLYFENLP